MLLGRFTLRSPAPPDEVRRRLDRLLAPVSAASITDAGGSRARPFRGTASDAEFTLRRVRPSGRSSFLRVRGRLAPEGAGTRVQVALGLAGLRPWMFLLVLAGGGARVLLALRDAARAGELAAADLPWLVAYPVLLALSLLVLLAERGRVRRLLGYLTGEMTARGLSHELAEARD